MTDDQATEVLEQLAEFDAFTRETGWGLWLSRHYLETGDLERARLRFEATRDHVRRLQAGEL